MENKTNARQRSTKMELLVKEVFRNDVTWDDLAEFFVRDKSGLQEELRRYMQECFEDGEEHLKMVEDRIAENERT